MLQFPVFKISQPAAPQVWLHGSCGFVHTFNMPLVAYISSSNIVRLSAYIPNSLDKKELWKSTDLHLRFAFQSTFKTPLKSIRLLTSLNYVVLWAQTTQHRLGKCLNFNGIAHESIYFVSRPHLQNTPDSPWRSCSVVQPKARWCKFYPKFCLNTDTCYLRLVDFKVWLSAGFQPQVQCKKIQYKDLEWQIL